MGYKWNGRFVQDLFGTNRTLIPAVVGTVAFLAGWAVSMGWLMGVGLVCVAAGVSLGLVRLVSDGEAIFLQQVRREEEAKRTREQAELDRVGGVIGFDTDRRTREYLKSLIALRRGFLEAVQQEDVVAFITDDFRVKFDRLFWKSVQDIERANRLLQTAKGMMHKDGVLDARSHLIEEVGENLLALTQSFEGLTTLALTQDQGGLDRLRVDLETKLSVAEAVSEELGGRSHVPTQDLKEYL